MPTPIACSLRVAAPPLKGQHQRPGKASSAVSLGSTRALDGDDDEGMNAYLDTIDAKLTVYENLLNDLPTLFPDQLGLVEGIVLTVLSFS